jgi:hypothetical protein
MIAHVLGGAVYGQSGIFASPFLGIYARRELSNGLNQPFEPAGCFIPLRRRGKTRQSPASGGGTASCPSTLCDDPVFAGGCVLINKLSFGKVHTMAGQAFGVIGLEVMGRNLALNIERNGFPIAVYNRTYAKTEHFINELAKGKNAKGAKTVQEFVNLLERPRRILIMVKAGGPVDAVIAELKPFLQQGDIVIDGGNSLFTDTERRARKDRGQSAQRRHSLRHLLRRRRGRALRQDGP